MANRRDEQKNALPVPTKAHYLPKKALPDRITLVIKDLALIVWFDRKRKINIRL